MSAVDLTGLDGGNGGIDFCPGCDFVKGLYDTLDSLFDGPGVINEHYGDVVQVNDNSSGASSGNQTPTGQAAPLDDAADLVIWGDDPASFGESLGIPAGVQVDDGGLLGVLGLPSSGCEFGACGVGASTFGPGGPSKGPNPLSVTSGAISVSGVFPILFGVLGPAVTVSYDPKNHLLCGGVGAGLSAGHTVGGGPVVVHAKPGNTSKDVLGGWSLSGGYNWTPFWGYQGSVNGSGYTAGYSFGVPGASGSVTFSWCRQGGGKG